jgi:hypothetical protein
MRRGAIVELEDAVGSGDEAVGAGGDMDDDFSGVLHPNKA